MEQLCKNLSAEFGVPEHLVEGYMNRALSCSSGDEVKAALVLRNMVAALGTSEVSESSDWWNGLSDRQREQYVKAHPNSKYAKSWKPRKKKLKIKRNAKNKERIAVDLAASKEQEAEEASTEQEAPVDTQSAEQPEPDAEQAAPTSDQAEQQPEDESEQPPAEDQPEDEQSTADEAEAEPTDTDPEAADAEAEEKIEQATAGQDPAAVAQTLNTAAESVDPNAAQPVPKERRGFVRALFSAGTGLFKAAGHALRSGANNASDALNNYSKGEASEKDMDTVKAGLKGVGMLFIGALAIGGLAYFGPAVLPLLIDSFLNRSSSSESSDEDTDDLAAFEASVIEDFISFLSSADVASIQEQANG